MATKKISALTSLAQDAIDPALDVLPINDTGATETKKATAAAIVGKSIGELSATWNDALTTFTAIKFNVTDTASDAGSLLADLQIGGSSRFSVSKAGNVSAAGTLAVTGASTLTGAVTFKAAAKSDSATAGIGYATGAGGTVTQASSRTTGVTLDKICGEITLVAGTISGHEADAFVLTNSTIAATDTVVVNIKSGVAAGTAKYYSVNVIGVAAGSCTISVGNLDNGTIPSTGTDTPVLNFAVIKAVAA
jgi:hypothetical protein